MHRFWCYCGCQLWFVFDWIGTLICAKFFLHIRPWYCRTAGKIFLAHNWSKLPNCWIYRASKILFPKHVTDFSKFSSLSFYFNLPEARVMVLFSFFVPVVHCFQSSLQWCSFGRDKPDFCMFVSVFSSFHMRIESRTSTSFCSLCGKVACLPHLGIFLDLA
jgi:hypothetical protein